MITVQAICTRAAIEDIVASDQHVVASAWLVRKVAYEKVAIEFEVISRAAIHSVVATRQSIVAGTAEEIISIEEGLVSRAAIHDVVAPPQSVIAGIAEHEVSGEEEVASSAAIHYVVATRQSIVAGTAEHAVSDHYVVSRAAGKYVVATDEPVVPITAVEKVPERSEPERDGRFIASIQPVVTALQYIVTAKADKKVSIHIVLTGAGKDRIVTALQYIVRRGADKPVAFQIVVAVVPEDDVISGAATHEVIAPKRVDFVVAAQAGDDVRTLGPHENVVALCAHDRSRDVTAYYTVCASTGSK